MELKASLIKLKKEKIEKFKHLDKAIQGKAAMTEDVLADAPAAVLLGTDLALIST